MNAIFNGKPLRFAVAQFDAAHRGEESVVLLEGVRRDLAAGARRRDTRRRGRHERTRKTCRTFVRRPRPIGLPGPRAPGRVQRRNRRPAPSAPRRSPHTERPVAERAGAGAAR
jgi:hypothetical protein